MSLSIIETPRKSVLVDMASRFGMEPAAFEATVRATCIKPDKHGHVASREEFAAFLLVAKQYGLNPLTKEIFAFTDRGGVVPIVSVDGWSNLINSHPSFDGMEFDDHPDGDGSLESITCRMYRKDRSHPIAVTEYMAECRRDTDTWRKWPRRMLRHKATIQAARYAFGFAGIYDEDEAQRIVSANQVPTPPIPPAPPPVPASAVRKQLEASVAQIEAEKQGFDFDAYRTALQSVQSNEEADGVWRQFVENAGAITEEETEECQAILNEATARFWKEEA